MSGPGRYDVVVIGGGIAGCASAYYLARRGLRVALFEKGEIAGEQSGRNWGFVRQQGRDPLELPLMIECSRMWRSLEAELEADIEWRQGGILYLAGSEAEMAGYEAWLEHARPYQLDTRLLSGAEVAALLPGMARDWAGGLYTASDGQADPIKATTAFARAAERHGAEVRTGCAVEAIETAGGAVTGVRTEAGEVAAGAVLVAAGAWTGPLLRTVGVVLPQLRVRSTVLRTTAAPDKTAIGVWGPGFGFRQRRDGTFNVGGGAWVDFDIDLDSLRYLRAFWPALRRSKKKIDMHVGRPLLDDLAALIGGREALVRRMRRDRVLDPAPSRTKVEHCLAGFRMLFPEFAALEVQTSWAGVIEVTPDEVAALGAVPEVAGLVVASGFSGHGFGFGPIAGRLMAELIADGQASLDYAGLRFTRFAEGAIGVPRAAH